MTARLILAAPAVMSGLVFLLNWGRYGLAGVLGGLVLVAAGLGLAVHAFRAAAGGAVGAGEAVGAGGAVGADGGPRTTENRGARERSGGGRERSGAARERSI